MSNPSPSAKSITILASFNSDRPELLHAILSSCQNGVYNLSLPETGFGPQGLHAIAIASFLAANTSLSILDLKDNNLIDGDAEILAGALPSNATLRRLDVSGN